MRKLRIIQEGIDVSGFLEEIMSLPDHFWVTHSKFQGQYTIPLTVGVVPDVKTNVLDSKGTVNTPYYYLCRRLVNWLRVNGLSHHEWAGIYRIPPGGKIDPHKDDTGAYYQDKMRYQLCIQGEYKYWVEGEPEVIIRPGTLFWFDLFETHSAECISDIERITFLFDLPDPSTIKNP